MSLKPRTAPWKLPTFFSRMASSALFRLHCSGSWIAKALPALAHRANRTVRESFRHASEGRLSPAGRRGRPSLIHHVLKQGNRNRFRAHQEYALAIALDSGGPRGRHIVLSRRLSIAQIVKVRV